MDKIHYNYNEIHNLTINLGNKIKKVYKPDLILAISGGGLIPARIIRNVINVPIISVCINYYKDDKIMDSPNLISDLDKSLIKNKNILIVDEIDDTRSTLKFICDRVDDLAKSIAIGVIHNKKKEKVCELNNLYFSGLDVEDKWIVYPWDELLIE